MVDGAAAGGAFEEFSVGVGGGKRDGEVELEALDPARLVVRHEFTDGDGHPFDGDFLALGDDADDGGHAGTERGGDEIGGREGLAAAVVVERGVGDEGVAGGHVDGAAVQVAFIGELDLDHDERSWKGN